MQFFTRNYDVGGPLNYHSPENEAAQSGGGPPPAVTEQRDLTPEDVYDAARKAEKTSGERAEQTLRPYGNRLDDKI